MDEFKTIANGVEIRFTPEMILEFRITYAIGTQRETAVVQRTQEASAELWGMQTENEDKYLHRCSGYGRRLRYALAIELHLHRYQKESRTEEAGEVTLECYELSLSSLAAKAEGLTLFQQEAQRHAAGLKGEPEEGGKSFLR